MTSAQRSTDYARVERAIGFMVDRIDAQPKLADVADAVGLSAHRTQKLFKRWAGVSPKRFLEFLTVEHAKDLLDRSESVLDASLAVGLSGPGRLHDHFVKLEGVSPGEYKSGGAGLEIRFGVHPSPFGSVFLATSGRGVCRLSFSGAGAAGRDRELATLERSWPGAVIVRDQQSTAAVAGTIFDAAGSGGEILVKVTGTNFQLAVWKALLHVPRGGLVSYQTVADLAGNARAAQAVGGAVGANPVAFLIPCHRVIKKSGALGGYRWGVARKRALLAWESARVSG